MAPTQLMNSGCVRTTISNRCNRTDFFLRVGREEALMIETFGDDYRRYMARTARILPGIY